jgi:predicted CXXCH cytochrome family protein
VDSPELTEAHYGIAVKGTGCTDCHEPHASATKGLMRGVVHAPFGDGSCELCHLLDSETPQLVRATGARLCGVCHEGYPREGDAVVHQPIADGNCSACHVPHASDVRRLLPRPSGELCASCHAAVAERAARSKSAHRVDDDKGACLACHAPHSSDEPHLLTAGEIRTCLVCHETAKHGHPLGDDRPDPRTGKPITCVTCHDPHGTAYPYQLRGDQSRGLCVECHDPQHEKPKGKSSGTVRD